MIIANENGRIRDGQVIAAAVVIDEALLELIDKNSDQLKVLERVYGRRETARVPGVLRLPVFDHQVDLVVALLDVRQLHDVSLMIGLRVVELPVVLLEAPVERGELRQLLADLRAQSAIS